MLEILLILVVAVCCAVALVKPQLGLYSYVCFALLRPDALAWSYEKYPYSMALAIATLAGSLRFLPNISAVFENPITVLLMALQAPIVLSAVLAVDPSLAYGPLQLYLRVVGMSLLIVILVRSKEQLGALLLVMGLSVGLLGAKFGLYGLVHGGVTLVSAHAGMDNNDLALGMAMVVPLCWYGRRLLSSLWAKAAMAAVTFLTVTAIVMTHSRGAALSLLAVFLMISFHSKRRAAAFGLMLLLAIPAVFLVRHTYLPRLATLESPSADSSAFLRFVYARGALEMWRDYPLLGVGFGSDNQMELWPKYMAAAGRTVPQVLHNTYLQMLVDSGILALLIYVSLLGGTIFWLGRSAAWAKLERPDLEVFPRALQVSLVAFAVGAVFFSKVKFDLTYMVLTSAASWHGIQRELSAKPSAVAAPAPIRILLAAKPGVLS